MEYQKSILVLKEILKANTEQFKNSSLYLKTPVVVGKNKSGDVLCNYFYHHFNPFWNEDYIVIHVLFDETEHELYSRNFNFTLISFEDEVNFDPRICEYEKNETLEIFPNALELILAEVNKTGQQWLDYQSNLQIRKKELQYKQSKLYDDNKKGLPWEERLELSRINIEYDWLLYYHTYQGDQDTLNEMIKLGEEAYNKKQAEHDAKMKPIIDKILAEMLEEEKK